MPRWVRVKVRVRARARVRARVRVRVRVKVRVRRVGVADELGLREHEALVDVVREVVHGALRRLLLGRVAGEAVVLGEVRQHHLRVALGAESACRSRLGLGLG